MVNACSLVVANKINLPIVELLAKPNLNDASSPYRMPRTGKEMTREMAEESLLFALGINKLKSFFFGRHCVCVGEIMEVSYVVIMINYRHFVVLRWTLTPWRRALLLPPIRFNNDAPKRLLCRTLPLNYIYIYIYCI